MVEQFGPWQLENVVKTIHNMAKPDKETASRSRIFHLLPAGPSSPSFTSPNSTRGDQVFKTGSSRGCLRFKL